MSRSDKPKKIKPGSFLEICLAPGYYTYARKLEGITAIAFYNFLSTVPNHDTIQLAHQTILLTTCVLDNMPWPVIGFDSLESTWSTSTYSWAFDTLSVKSSGSSWASDMQIWFANPATKVLLIEKRKDPISGAIDSIQSPAKLEELQGLPRQTIYWPETIEDKLRIHDGLTPEGERIIPLPLKQQPLW